MRYGRWVLMRPPCSAALMRLLRVRPECPAFLYPGVRAAGYSSQTHGGREGAGKHVRGGPGVHPGGVAARPLGGHVAQGRAQGPRGSNCAAVREDRRRGLQACGGGPCVPSGRGRAWRAGCGPAHAVLAWGDAGRVRWCGDASGARRGGRAGWPCAAGGPGWCARPDPGLGGWVRSAGCRAACCPPASLWPCEGLCVAC